MPSHKQFNSFLSLTYLFYHDLKTFVRFLSREHNVPVLVLVLRVWQLVYGLEAHALGGALGEEPSCVLLKDLQHKLKIRLRQQDVTMASIRLPLKSKHRNGANGSR